MVAHLRRQSVSVVEPVRWLSPFSVLLSVPGLRGQNGVEEPGKSRLMSQKGSIVVETPLQGHRTGLTHTQTHTHTLVTKHHTPTLASPSSCEHI